MVTQLVNQPDALVLHEEIHGGMTCYLLDLPPSEVGKVIGKQGHTIRAIRSLLVAVASRHDKQCAFEIIERAANER